MAERRTVPDGSTVRPHRPGRTITCYYCGLVLHEKHLQSHMQQCHLVLEGCPNKCGMTIERHAMQNHLDSECMNRRRVHDHSDKSASMQPAEEWNDKVVAALMVIKKALLKEENERSRAEAEWKLELKKLTQQVEATSRNAALPQINVAEFLELKHNVFVLTQSLMEEQNERHRIEQQLGFQLQQTEELKLRLEQFGNGIKREEEVLQEVVQERQLRLRAETELKMEAAKLEDLCCALEQWRDERKKAESEYEAQWKQQQQSFAELRELVDKCCREVDEFREFLASENVMISGLWTEQLAEVHRISDRLELLSKEAETKSKELAQLKQSVTECDDAIMRQARGSSSLCFGHMIWKISDFETKMSDAKKNNTVLLSPMFYSAQHGYKLRVEVRLNGMGQWTGRHMTASLQVLEGEWDPLLQWPFNQRVTLTLRDQSKSPDKVKNLEKNLVAGQEKEDPAGLHVFIPHSTLNQHSYIDNNTMYLEVTVS